MAAAAVALRWGSYLSVLLDRDKPVWSAAQSGRISRISDDEMARINIESSAALAEWIDIRRGDSRLHARLVDRAVSYLIMPAEDVDQENGVVRRARCRRGKRPVDPGARSGTRRGSSR